MAPTTRLRVRRTPSNSASTPSTRRTIEDPQQTLDVPRRAPRRPLHEVDQRLGDDLRGHRVDGVWEGRGAPADAITASQKVGRRAQTPSGIILK